MKNLTKISNGVNKKFFAILVSVFAVCGMIAITGTVEANGAVPHRVTVIINVADRLVYLQKADGDFPWRVGETPTPGHNTLGITAMGILKAWELDPKAGYNTALAKAYKYVVDNPPEYTWDGSKYTESTKGVDSNPDITFLVWLSQAAASDTELLNAIVAQVPDTTPGDIAALAKTRWDNRVLYLGSTQEDSPNGTATGLAEYIRDVRHDQNYDSLIPWDLEAGVKAALALDSYYPEGGYDQQAIDIAEVIYNSIDDDANVYFGSTDTDQEEYVLGLTGGIEAFQEVNLYPDKAADLKTNLLAIQQAGGYWNYYGTTPATMSVQSTAYAVMALFEEGSADAITAANRAADWLVKAQSENGGWFAEGGAGDEYAEIDSEAAWALAVLPAPVTIGTDGYYTIQSAVTGASAGDTINVAAGTYNENIVVDKPLTLRGANAGIPGSGIRGGAESIINAADNQTYVVEITADSVTLDGFTITGLAKDSDNMAAVITWGVDNCTIKNNILTDNYKDAINLYSVSDAYSDYNTVSNNLINGPNDVETFGIKIKGSHNTISGNEVYNADTSIHVWSWDDSEATSSDYNIISNNTIAQGEGGTANHKYGIEIKTGQHNEVIDNIITNATRAAIYLYTSGRMATENDFDPRPAYTEISGNTITGGEVGIALLEGANNNTISGNDISSTTVAGILGSLSRWISEDGSTWEPGETYAAGSDPSNDLVGAPTAYLQIASNTIENNTISNCGHGIAMQYGDENRLTGNTIENNTGDAAIGWHGVSFTAEGRGVYFDANSSGNVVNYNNISGNSEGGLQYENTTTTLDATNNWWGDPSGPSGVGFGTGDAVNGDVDYDPWLDAPAPDGEPITFTGVKQETVTDGTIDAKDEADTKVIVTGGPATITMAKYSDNPGSGLGEILSGDIGKYIDIHIDNFTTSTELEIRLYYTDDEIAGKDESTLKMYWWNGTNWLPCSDTGVNTSLNYIWAKINDGTTPDLFLGEIPRTPFAGAGNAAAAPTYSSSRSGQFSYPVSRPKEPETTVKELETRIAELRAMIAELRAQLVGPQVLGAVVYEGIPNDFTFKNNLEYGMTSDEVKYLQIILKVEVGPPTYPENVPATGWFGPITQASVIKFQEKYALEVLTPWNLTQGTGFVGKTTRDKLNKLLGK